MPGSLDRSLTLLLTTSLVAGCASEPHRPAPERRPPDVGQDDTREAPPVSSPEAADADRELPEQTRDAPPSREPQTRSLLIDLSDQQFRYSEDGELARSGPISSGTADHPTPTGRFAVLSKDEDKVSSLYTNQLGMQAWMPYSIQFHGNYFVHEGWLPGYPDSHGCVRVGEQDARFLFQRLELGDRVEVRR